MCSRGQASLDYVAALALVAVLLAGAGATVGAPWLGGRLADAIRRGICVVAGSYCSASEAARAGLVPCTVAGLAHAERAGVTAILHVGRDDVLLVERRSDGTVAIAFVDGWRGGAEIGIGLPVGASGALRATAAFNAGRVWELPDWPSAQRFLHRFAGEETLTGEARRRLRRLCPACEDGPSLPPPAARFEEGGWDAEAWARLGVAGVSADGRTGGLTVAGRRRAGRRDTLYVRVGGATAVHLGAILASVTSGREAEAVLELTTQDGRLVEARVRAAAEVADAAELGGRSADVGELAARLRGAVGRPGRGGEAGGVAVEAAVRLDLTDPANRHAVEGLLRPGLSPLGWVERARALGRRLDVAGAIDLAIMRTRRRVEDHQAGVGALVRLGAGYRRTEHARELLAAWALRAGGALRRREDCEAG